MHNHKSIFTCPEWMQHPWNGFQRSPLDDLTDLYFDMAAAIQESKTIFYTANQTRRQESLQGLITTLTKLDSDITTYYNEFHDLTPGPLYWAELSILENCTDDPTLGKLFPVSYYFPSFFISQIVVMYWNAMVMIHLHISVTYDVLAMLGSSPKSDSTRSAEHDAIWRRMVDNLCQSAEYFSRDTVGGLGPMTVFPFLYGAKLCLERRPAHTGSDRNVQWISDCVQKMLMKFHFPVENMLGDYETWKGQK